MAQQKAKVGPKDRKNPEKTFTDNKFTPTVAKTAKQKQLLQAAKDFQIVAATGSAGTGKTHLLVSQAAADLHFGKINKIVVTRPYQNAVSEEYGYLSGDITEKYSWCLDPVRAILEKALGKTMVEYFIKNGNIEAVPLGFMRGRTFEQDTTVIADEMQNSTAESVEMLLTRLGGQAKCYITGDLEQGDVRGVNGLEVLVKYAMWMPYAKHIELGLEDIVRSKITSDIIKSFRQYREDVVNQSLR